MKVIERHIKSERVKRKPAGMCKDILDPFPPFLLSQKKMGYGRTHRRTDQWTDGGTDGWTYPLIEISERI